MLQGVVLLVASCWLIYRIGRAAAGTGSFADALLVMVWLQFIMLGLQVGAACGADARCRRWPAIVELGGLVLFLWLLTNFIAELHGFRSLALVFGGIVCRHVAGAGCSCWR